MVEPLKKKQLKKLQKMPEIAADSLDKIVFEEQKLISFQPSGYLDDKKSLAGIEYKKPEGTDPTKIYITKSVNESKLNKFNSKLSIPIQELPSKSYEETLIRHFLASPKANENSLKADKEGGDSGIRIYQKFVQETEENTRKIESSAFAKFSRPKRKYSRKNDF